MFSDAYNLTVEKIKQFHKENKVWNGDATPDYADAIKFYVEKHNATSLLDYGCGKALHYDKNSHIKFGKDKNQTFDELLNIDNIFKYDPGVDQFSALPPLESKFDAVIAIQSIPAVPDQDFPIVVEQLMKLTNKFCFIGSHQLSKPVKQKKRDLLDPEYFRIIRTQTWYEDQFKNWTGSELILHWI